MVYDWKIKLKTDANIAGKVCEHLSETVGLTAENLVNASRNETDPLHDEFEWNDTTAAEEYRKTQARFIIRNLVTITENTAQEDKEPIRAFFALTSGFNETKIYEPTKVIMSVVGKRNTLLDIALQELNAFRKKYRALSELAEVFEAIERLDAGGAAL